LLNVVRTSVGPPNSESCQISGSPVVAAIPTADDVEIEANLDKLVLRQAPKDQRDDLGAELTEEGLFTGGSLAGARMRPFPGQLAREILTENGCGAGI
jgi:hypothetical protein